jgi:tRNA G10  N-methylase Trm11
MQTAAKKELVVIPGKNWRLSLAELVSFLDTRGIAFLVRDFSREFFAINVDADEAAGGLLYRE